jgi:hypothetical protein
MRKHPWRAIAEALVARGGWRASSAFEVGRLAAEALREEGLHVVSEPEVTFKPPRDGREWRAILDGHRPMDPVERIVEVEIDGRGIVRAQESIDVRLFETDEGYREHVERGQTLALAEKVWRELAPEEVASRG